MGKVTIKMFVLFLVLGIGLSACSASREQEVENDISSFRTWVNEQAASLENKTEEDWKQAKEDFKIRTADLDQREDQFSAEVKEEYKQIKSDFSDLDEKRIQIRRDAQATAWDTKLLGKYADWSTITTGNVKDVYINFMENVRSMRSMWTNEDWEMAKEVLNRLNDRKEIVDDELSTEDEVKIKALQMEFRTLETANDVGGK
jgi:hypothetical protein